MEPTSRTIVRLRLRQPRTRKAVIELVVGGIAGRWFARHGWGAFTLPLPFVCFIFYWATPVPSPFTRVHEFAHVAQDEADRLFVPRYLARHLRHGYRRNPYEQQANAAESAAHTEGLPDWAR
jgi:hypothetical protein